MKCGVIPKEYRALYRRLVKKGLAKTVGRVQGSVNALEKPAPANVAPAILKYKEHLDQNVASVRFAEAQLEHPSTQAQGEAHAHELYQKAVKNYVAKRWEFEHKLPDIPEAVQAHPALPPSHFYKVPDFMENPESPMDALKATDRMNRDAAKAQFLSEGQQNGEIGSRGPDSPFVNPEHPYQSLSLHPDHLFGVHPSVKPIYDQILSYHDGAPGKLQTIQRSIISTIMWNPAFHAVNIGGRFIPQLFRAKGLKRIGPAFQKALSDLNSPQKMGEYAKDGFTPYFPHGFEANDFADRIFKRLQSKTEGNLPRMAEFFSKWPKVLSTAVNTMGLTYRHLLYDQFIDEGFTHEEASVKAAHAATDLAGTMGRDMFKEGASKMGDFALFSLRYTSTTFNLGIKALRDDNVLRKKLEMRGVPPDRMGKILLSQKRAYRMALLRDYMTNMAMVCGLNYLMTAYNHLPDKDGKKGGHFPWQNPGAKWTEALMPTRIDWKLDNGQMVSISTPFRTTRDLLEWVNLLTSPLDAGRLGMNKSSPLIHVAQDMVSAAHGDLTLPRIGMTDANVLGKLFGDVSPVNIQNILVESATSLYGESLRPLIQGIYSGVTPQSLEEFGLYLVGMQTGKNYSSEDQFDALQAWKAKQAIAHFRNNPAVRRLLEMRDPTTIRLFYQESEKAGLSPKMTHLMMRYLLTPQTATRSGMQWKAAHP